MTPQRLRAGWGSLRRATPRVLVAIVFSWILPSIAQAAEPRVGADDEQLRKSTAATLNYCRASFYRIQRFPTYRVLVEEQEKILNNLDLNGILDQEVVKLYTGVLVEISEVRMAARERQLVHDKFQSSMASALSLNAFDLTAQLAQQQYLSAVRTGVRSWWDFRNISAVREIDKLHIDQKRLMAFTEKSALFLDVFWKLARDRKIPDRWLIRNQDLERLDAALQESDPAVRLRVLHRMRDFMTCYPPYWYYVARTQQGLGLLPEADKTYQTLVRIGHGHFRKDDMLAAGLANRAVIQDYLQQPAAVETALTALGYSTDAWEANLMCARVLGAHERFHEAEDAILRNLDVDIERTQSLVALISLYVRSRDVDKLRARLSLPATVRSLPMPLLLRSAAALGPQQVPDAVAAAWVHSVSAHYDLGFGPDDFVIHTSPAWNLQSSEMSLVVADESHSQSTIALSAGQSEIRFAKVGEFGRPVYAAASTSPPATLVVKLPDLPLVRLKFETPAEAATPAGFPGADLLVGTSRSGKRPAMRLASLEIGEASFPLIHRAHGGAPASTEPIIEPLSWEPSHAGPTLVPAITPTTITPVDEPAAKGPTQPSPGVGPPSGKTPSQPPVGS